MRPAWTAWGQLLALAVTACTVAPPPAPEPPPVSFTDPGYQGFLTPAPLLPLRAEGAVQFFFRGERETGELILQGAPGPAFRLQLQARMTGALVLELDFDAQGLLVLDYAGERYYRGGNTAENRERLFSLDLTPEEFQTLVTGRVTRAVFQDGVGRLEGERAAYRAGADDHRFLLGEGGLPREWVKERQGRPVFRVEFREYQEAPQAAGPPLLLPRKVRLYRDGGEALLVLGFHRIFPGRNSGTRPDPALLPDGTTGFAPGRFSDLVPAPR
jgi:hypothetical protein